MKKTIIKTVIALIILAATATGTYYYGKSSVVTPNTVVKAQMKLGDFNIIMTNIDFYASKIDTVKHKPELDSVRRYLFVIAHNIDSVNHLK
ncbi:MAG: hypothetical protein JWQ30_1032 [Sediminibacterium sp.]|nr:hypothetical protein [Sediminibacterium sp.]